MPKKRVCVIGSGASGLTAIKCCLDEELEPVCYEMDYDIGGLWRYEEKEREMACVYKSTIINTSKEMMCFSDFPIPKDFANFMHNTKIVEYLRLYCEEFNLLNHIHFNTEVLSCKQSEDYKETGKWKVTTKNRKTSEEATVEFDGVLVCVGHHASPYFPKDSFPGVHNFEGDVLHSHSYRTPEKYSDKRVVVIGIGNSGVDLSVEIGNHAKKLFLSTRRGSWIHNRIGPNGVPGDILLSRFSALLQANFPSLINRLSAAQLNKKFDHVKYGLKPKHKVFEQHPTINDALPNSILSGRVVVKGNVVELTETGVIFEDGSYEDADVVIFATGFKFNFKFLDDSILEVSENDCSLYRRVWPANLSHGTLAIIGGIQPLGAINPISEMQSRWASRVFKGLLTLPSKVEMDLEIDKRREEIKKKLYLSPRHTLEVNYVGYINEIAHIVGVNPDLWSWLKKDFWFGMKLVFGPCTPVQFRLEGPGKWKDAYTTIMTVDERVQYPLATRKVSDEKKNSNTWIILVFIVCIFALYTQW